MRPEALGGSRVAANRGVPDDDHSGPVPVKRDELEPVQGGVAARVAEMLIADVAQPRPGRQDDLALAPQVVRERRVAAETTKVGAFTSLSSRPVIAGARPADRR